MGEEREGSMKILKLALGEREVHQEFGK